ncbi:MAG: DNA polymerase III subunit delta [Gammaproteobacteria bacterium]
MKLAARQLAAHLTNSLAPVYLVAGDEPLVVAEALESIRTRARQDGFEHRDLVVVERGFKWAELEGDVDNLSLFATRRIVELRLASPRPGEAGGRIIRSMVERPDPDRLLLIATTKLDSAAAKSVWVKTIDKHGIVVRAWPIERPELPTWIRERAGRIRLRLSTSAAELLADRVEGNLLAADQEIQKLALLLGEGDVDEQMVLEAVASNTRFDVFRLTDAILAGNSNRSLAVLSGLRAEGVAPALVLWALSRELCLLARLRSATLQGDSEDRALSRQHVWSQRQPLVKKALQRFRLHQLTALLAQAAEVDHVIKGVSKGRPWDGLTQLVIAMLVSERLQPGRAA